MAKFPKEKLQEIFDTTVRALAKQGKKSYGDLPDQAAQDSGFNKMCLYRSPDGCKCALGVHIPDDKYAIELEGQSAGFVINKLKLPLPVEFMGLLQTAHDGAWTDQELKFVNIWDVKGIATELNRVGLVFELDVVAVEEAFGIDNRHHIGAITT